MKKIFVLALAAILTAGAYAKNPAAVNEKVLNSFKATFTSAEKVKWFEADNNYSVRFFQSDVRYIVYYDKKGNITNSMKFYDPALLPVTILKGLRDNHASMKAIAVTEITAEGETAYFIKSEDTKYWYTVRMNAFGESDIYEKVKKQQ